jgi:hypothetical protein
VRATAATACAITSAILSGWVSIARWSAFSGCTHHPRRAPRQPARRMAGSTAHSRSALRPSRPPPARFLEVGNGEPRQLGDERFPQVFVGQQRDERVGREPRVPRRKPPRADQTSQLLPQRSGRGVETSCGPGAEARRPRTPPRARGRPEPRRPPAAAARRRCARPAPPELRDRGRSRIQPRPRRTCGSREGRPRRLQPPKPPATGQPRARRQAAFGFQVDGPTSARAGASPSRSSEGASHGQGEHRLSHGAHLGHRLEVGGRTGRSPTTGIVLLRASDSSLVVVGGWR